MRRKSREAFLIQLLLIGLLAVTGFAYWEMNRSETSAKEAVVNVAVCRQLTARVQDLQYRPQLAALEARSTSEMARRIETAAKGAKISTQGLVSIEPQAARRLPKLPYQEQPTAVEVKDVPLSALIVFLHRLANEEPKLNVTSFRLFSPRHDAQGKEKKEELWRAEVVLTYLIYSPTIPPASP